MQWRCARWTCGFGCTGSRMHDIRGWAGCNPSINADAAAPPRTQAVGPGGESCNGLAGRDIPALLDCADSTTTLKDFPRNPVSSQFEPECSEGMVALWLIEGFATASRPDFGSLNRGNRMPLGEPGCPSDRD